MIKRSVSLAVLFFITFFLMSSVVAQEDKKELMAKLTDLRGKKAQLMTKYNEDLCEINKAADDNIAELKKKFRIERQRCLDDKSKKSVELRKDFESKLKPMLKEERELAEEIGRDAREDFVKSRQR